MNFEDRLREAAARYADSPEEIERLVASAKERLKWRIRRGHKVCSRCHEAKHVAAFGMDSRERDGLHRVCRRCRTPGGLPS